MTKSILHKIDKNVPLPKSLSERVSLGAIPLKDMKVGDSIVFTAITKRELLKKIRSVRMRCTRFAKKHPHYKFRVALEAGKNNKEQIRVWRVSRAN